MIFRDKELLDENMLPSARLLESCIKEHKKDKLKNFNGDIYYFTCSNKINMDMLEYVLINKYHPKFNYAGNVSHFVPIKH